MRLAETWEKSIRNSKCKDPEARVTSKMSKGKSCGRLECYSARECRATQAILRCLAFISSEI